MFRDALRAEFRTAIERAQHDGAIPAGEIPPFDVEIPRDRRHGDYAANAAMMLAKQTGLNPRDVAQRLIAAFPASPDRVARLNVAGPGFINITLAWPWRRELIATINRLGESYGRQTLGAGKRVNVEFVSANPTGPLHVGTGRNAVIGDVVGNLLTAVGYQVSREYYINDAGQQVYALARSVQSHYLTALGRPTPVPEDGYHGDYVAELARRIVDADGDRWLHASEVERLEHFRDVSVEAVVAEIRDTLEQFGVRFDTWFSERAMVQTGAVERALATLRAHDAAYDDAEGKAWFRATSFGDTEDRVIFRPGAGWTYFGSDIAYHLDKLARGFDHLIDVWAIDHIGAVPRLKGGLQALGAGGALEILIYQHVRLKNEGEALRMSKRRGDFVSLGELIDAVGVDAGRYFYAMFSPTAPMDFDVALARRQSQDNPVYYVQYAHARIAGIVREAAAAGDAAAADPNATRAGPHAAAPLDRLTDEREAALIHTLAELPDVIRLAGLRREPHRLCAYGREVAEAFHLFYTHCRVLGDDRDLSAARLALVEAARIVLRRVLGLLGVSAPDRM
jgi:arginyl-tRNA synthetase